MSASAMTEMVKESRMGAIGSLNTTRQVRQIDLSDFQNRKTHNGKVFGAGSCFGFNFKHL